MQHIAIYAEPQPCKAKQGRASSLLEIWNAFECLLKDMQREKKMISLAGNDAGYSIIEQFLRMKNIPFFNSVEPGIDKKELFVVCENYADARKYTNCDVFTAEEVIPSIKRFVEMDVEVNEGSWHKKVYSILIKWKGRIQRNNYLKSYIDGH